MSKLTFPYIQQIIFSGPTYRCLPCRGNVAVGLTQDLTLILSTKKHQIKQDKTNKPKTSN